MEAHSATGIPVEYLFTVIGVLLTWIYLDMKRELKSLRKNAEMRSVMIDRLRIALSLVCRKLNVPFGDILKVGGDEHGDEDSWRGQ
ncbi:MAG TPA: hypothetical protein VMF03_00210 [Steroidobacteraceae bacterium]|nr:hypothetical protein [Steroidobacteraceae bacterium]